MLASLLAGASFRRHAAYDLVEYACLGAAQRASLASLAVSSDFFGVLVPRGVQGLCVKSVSRGTATLLEHFTTANTLPESTTCCTPSAYTLARLVADCVLEADLGF